ncbi:MAG: LCP family protein [Vampirovibrionales bacterium]|nr:LCP family protein [Vampirovibrionales bacterium]
MTTPSNPPLPRNSEPLSMADRLDMSSAIPAGERPSFGTVSKKTARRRGPWWEVSLLVMLCALLVVLVGQFVWQSDQPLTKNMSFQLPGVMPTLNDDMVLLVMGVDAGNNLSRRASGKGQRAFQGARTDTMLLVRLNPHKNTVGMVSIPRDSKVYLPSSDAMSETLHVDKINAAHAIGGLELAKKTVESAFGIPVDHAVVINFAGVHDIVDALGGLDIFVEKPLRYHDFSGKLHIDFQPGLRHMNGHQAEAFLRFRHDAMGDIGRIQRQQYFLAALLQKLKQPATLVKMPDLIKASQQDLETDMSFDDLLRVGFFAKKISPATVRAATLPGRPSQYGRVSYWVVEPDGAKTVLDHVILETAVPDVLPLANSQTGKPIWRVGLFYDPALSESLPAIIGALESQGFTVGCKRVMRGVHTALIERQVASTFDEANALRNALGATPGMSGIKRARLLFSPPYSTYDNLQCSASEDYTVMLGAELMPSSTSKTLL